MTSPTRRPFSAAGPAASTSVTTAPLVSGADLEALAGRLVDASDGEAEPLDLLALRRGALGRLVLRGHLRLALVEGARP